MSAPVLEQPRELGPDPAIGAEVRKVLEEYFASDSARPFPGQFGIQERRTWHSWQLVVAVLMVLVLGMWVGSVSSGTRNPAQQSGAHSYRLPAPAGSAAAAGPTSGAIAGSTSSAAATTATTVAASTSSTIAPGNGQVAVLLGPTQSTGNWTSSSFAISGGTWNIGWAYQCTPAPSAGTSLQIFVDPSTGTPATSAAVRETGGSGNGVTPQTSTGAQRLRVLAPSQCIWAVKVTGIS